MRSRLFGLAVALASLAAFGSPRLDAARAHVSAAFAYFDEARYEDAIRELDTAFALDPVPELQYNLAQCHERLNHPAQARAAYQRYLDVAPHAPDRAEVLQRLVALKDAPEGASPAPPPPPPERVVLKTVVIYREPPPPPGRGARYAGYGAAGLAAASALTAVVTGVLASRATNQVTQGGNASTPIPYDGQVRAAGDLAPQLWFGCELSAGLSAAFAVSAFILFRAANVADAEAPRVTLAPTLGPGGGGLVVRGLF